MSATLPPEILSQIEATLLARDGTRKGDEIAFRCTEHDDQNPSASFNALKAVWKCHGCGAKGGWKKIAAALGIETPNRAERRRQVKAERRIVATYDYRDEASELLFQVVRFNPKDFRQRRPDGNGDWVWNLDGVRRVLYRLPDLLASAEALVFIVEGEKDVERLSAAGLIATCNPMGAGKWLPEYTEQLRGRRVVIIPDTDRAGREHADAVAAQLFGVAASVAVLELPGQFGSHGADVTDWLGGGTVNTIDELVRLAGLAEPMRAVALDELVATFRRWLHLPDPAALYIVLATVIANRMRGDAVWLMIIAAPGHGKTEAVGSLARVPYVFQVATLTESALLSGTAQRDRSKDATGGLLRQIGDFGIIVCKDFTSLLSMHKDARAGTLAALREVYDGSWTRRIGADGGRALSWSGKVGLIAACTPAIDGQHGVVSSMGDRFVNYRLPDTDEDAQALAALNSIGSEDAMRAELSASAKAFLDGIQVPEPMPALADAERLRLSALAALAVRCRSAVERDPYRREIIQIPQAEAPARVARVLAKILIGLRVIGVPAPNDWQIIERCALDCMPAVRRSVFDVLRATPKPMETSEIAQTFGYPTETARRALQDLAAHGVLTCESQGKGNAHVWALSDWTRKRLAQAGVSEISGTRNTERNSRTVSETPGDEHTENNKSSSLFKYSIRAKDGKTEKVSPPFYDDAREDGPEHAPSLPTDTAEGVA